MGSMIDMASQFEVADIYSQINYKDKPVRVSPLRYASPIKWLTNQSKGIPAYIMIDMATQSTELVKLEKGIKIPVVITVYEDRSFSFITKMPPMAVLIIKELGLAKGSGAPHKDKVGKITQAQCEKIAAQKLPDLNTKDIKQAAEMVKGTCKSMGVDVVK
jgi:ribosomal protein L11